MASNKLTDNHRRVISSRVQLIERSIKEIELLLEAEQPLLEQVTEPLTKTEVNEMLGNLHKIQDLLVELSECYRLKFYKKSQRAMILSRLSNMLDISENMYAKKLTGYGSFNPELKPDYNKSIEKLEKAIKETFTPFR